MSLIPIIPRQRRYRGSTEELSAKAAEFNKAAKRAADYLNSLCANNPAEVQQYTYREIASAVDTTAAVVREAIGNGGSTGITLGVRAADREALSRFKK